MLELTSVAVHRNNVEPQPSQAIGRLWLRLRQQLGRREKRLLDRLRTLHSRRTLGSDATMIKRTREMVQLYQRLEDVWARLAALDRLAEATRRPRFQRMAA